MSPSPPIKMDKYSFLKSMKNIGRAYGKQAKELLSISRLFVQAQNQTFDSVGHQSLVTVLQAVDDALKSAADAKKKASDGADEAFKSAVSKLKDYGRTYHPKEPVEKRMKEAEEEDKSSMKALNRLKETFRPLEVEPTTEVDFLLHNSLPDRNPTTVTQVLGKNSNMSEILWNFSRKKNKERLTLNECPHFYEVLPESPGEYGDNFRRLPIEQVLDTLGKFLNGSRPKISVLTNRQGRIYLQSEQGPRAFGNVWCPQKAIIFKDVCGKLEGEMIVGSSIKVQSNLLYCEERLLSPTSANTMDWKPLQDWREPIRRLLKSSDHDICNLHISMEQPDPHKARKVSPFIPNHRPSGMSNLTKRTGSGGIPTSSGSTQHRPAVPTGMSSKHETAQSPPPSSASTQLPPAVTAGVLPNHRISQPPSPSSTSTQPLPAAATGVTSSDGSAQSPPPYQEPPPTPTPPDRATPSPVPLLTKTRPASPNQHHQRPPNVAQELQSQARTFTKTTLNISLEVVGVASQLNSPSVAITTHAQAEFTSSHKSHDESSRNVPGLAGPLGHKLEGLANKASKPNATPPPSQTQTNWGLSWFQSYWKGGK